MTEQGKRLLKSKMSLVGDTNETLAEHINCHPSTLYNKLNGTTDFKKTEISLIKDRYNLTPEEVEIIFLGSD